MVEKILYVGVFECFCSWWKLIGIKSIDENINDIKDKEISQLFLPFRSSLVLHELGFGIQKENSSIEGSVEVYLVG